MTYESEVTVQSQVATGVAYTVARVSFERRLELMRKIRDLAKRMEFLDAGQAPGDKMDAALLRTEIDRMWLLWGLRGIIGLEIDGQPATPELLTYSGPEELFREALTAVQAQTALTSAERKN
jgi:hypothetical protein